MKSKISVSLMCMNLLDVRKQIEILNKRTDFYHVDLMDGHYAKNITLSPDFVKSIKEITEIPIDVHMMTEYPLDFIEILAKNGADYISVHAETINSSAFRVINTIKDLGCKVGIVLNPATPFSCIRHYVHLIDKLTIMSVDVGFAGQKFISEMLEKIAEAKKYKLDNNLEFLIEVDGSCNVNTFSKLYNAGTEVFIVGSSGLFSLDDDLDIAYSKLIENFKRETGQ